jgi:hypothetical protein
MTIMTEVAGSGFRGIVFDKGENVVHSTVAYDSREAAYRAAKELRAALLLAQWADFLASVE